MEVINIYNKTCCFSGHRNMPEDALETIKKRLEAEIVDLLYQGVRYFYTGIAPGFETLAALTVLKLKNHFSYIQLILVLPGKDQSANWRADDKKIDNQILAQADNVVYVADNNYGSCRQEYTRYLVDNRRFCICYLTGAIGGTAHTVDYAKQRGLRIINIASA